MTSDRAPARSSTRGSASAPATTTQAPAAAATLPGRAGSSAAPPAASATARAGTPIAPPVPSEAANVVAQAGTPRFELAPHNCFACGTLNAHGLGLVLHVEHGRSWTELSLDRAFEGWEGIAHGGILCTILDEVMAWALVGTDNWGVTARMNVSFHAPVAVGRPIRAEAFVTKSRRRIVETSAQLVDVESGDVLASATGTYVAAGADRKRALRERYGFRLLASDTPAPAPASGDPS